MTDTSEQIAAILADQHWGTDRKHEQLAKLIAAEKAPLAEALKTTIEVMRRVDGENDCSRGLIAAEAALEKAGVR